MTEPVVMAELWRGGHLEGVHRGHAVVVDATGQIVEAWGDPGRMIFPRSSIKMIQALPLVESGAADRIGLGDEELALACASHLGSRAHTDRVARWLAAIERCEADLRCGPQTPEDATARRALRAAGQAPGQIHNYCSGKHTGFLTLAREMGSGSEYEYIEVDHPVQRAVRGVIEEMTGVSSPGHGIDGCSAPNFLTSLRGFAHALARFAAPDAMGPARAAAARRIVGAMRDHPVLIDGVGGASFEITAAGKGKVVVKTGAEGVFSAILPGRGLGVALKIEDGATRASEAAIAALLVHLGIFEAAEPVVAKRMHAVQPNRRGIAAGHVIAAKL